MNPITGFAFMIMLSYPGLLTAQGEFTDEQSLIDRYFSAASDNQDLEGMDDQDIGAQRAPQEDANILFIIGGEYVSLTSDRANASPEDGQNGDESQQDQGYSLMAPPSPWPPPHDVGALKKDGWTKTTVSSPESRWQTFELEAANVEAANVEAANVEDAGEALEEGMDMPAPAPKFEGYEATTPQALAEEYDPAAFADEGARADEDTLAFTFAGPAPDAESDPAEEGEGDAVASGEEDAALAEIDEGSREEERRPVTPHEQTPEAIGQGMHMQESNNWQPSSANHYFPKAGEENTPPSSDPAAAEEGTLSFHSLDDEDDESYEDNDDINPLGEEDLGLGFQDDEALTHLDEDLTADEEGEGLDYEYAPFYEDEDEDEDAYLEEDGGSQYGEEDQAHDDQQH